jgi:uncharacterized protein DUF5995
MSVLSPILSQTPASTIDDVLATMQKIDAALPQADGISCFNKLYLEVTKSVIAAEQNGRFTDVPFLSALDVAFGNLYFAALRQQDGGLAPPRAWAPLFPARSRADIAPIQFALAGMNAHINRDLPVGLVDTFASLEIEMVRPSPQASDYDKVNDVLAATESEVASEYFTPLMKKLDRDFDGLDNVVANWSVREARAAAWVNGATLWSLRGSPALSQGYLDTLDGIVGFAGRGLLVSLG